MLVGDVWYDNPAIRGWRGKLDRHESAFRWGSFIERVQQCDFVPKMTDDNRNDYVQRFRSILRAAQRREGEAETVFVINMPIFE
jgi:hypothetical protein